MVSLLGCGGGSNGQGSGSSTIPPAVPVVPTNPVTAAAIVTQPASQSVPMGLTATFSVAATGTSLSYQWSKGGSPISGATASSYTTPATAFADTGSGFTVAVSNSAGVVTSNSASLTVTARAPKAGDLRFQQVDAASTISGYSANPSGVSPDAKGSLSVYFANSIGTPLFLSPSICTATSSTSGSTGNTCSWQSQQFLLPSPLTGLGLSLGYGGDVLTNFAMDLQSSSFPAKGDALNSPDTVITSLDFEPAENLFSASWIQTSQGGGFDVMQQMVAPEGLQDAANQEGAHSRVITAFSYFNGQIVYLSYGWQTDTTTVYETQVATATSVTLPAVAANLASQGYVLTAMGGAESNDSLLVVGTRVKGDSVARPFVSAALGAEATSVLQPGYAIVGVVHDSAGNTTYLGER